MNKPVIAELDASLDLVLEREIDVPIERVWEAWTKAEHLMKWFVPRPWTLAACEIDVRPGGKFVTVMRSPEGQEHPSAGCYLDVVPMERLVFTDALRPGYRPAESPFMTAVVTMVRHGSGTLYKAAALHSSAAARLKHEEMGFHGGWSTALEQMVKHIRNVPF